MPVSDILTFAISIIVIVSTYRQLGGSRNGEQRIVTGLRGRQQRLCVFIPFTASQ